MPQFNNSSIHFAILVKKMENMVKLVFGLLLISIVLITCRSADSYYIGKIPTCTIIGLAAFYAWARTKHFGCHSVILSVCLS